MDQTIAGSFLLVEEDGQYFEGSQRNDLAILANNGSQQRILIGVNDPTKKADLVISSNQTYVQSLQVLSSMTVKGEVQFDMPLSVQTINSSNEVLINGVQFYNSSIDGINASISNIYTSNLVAQSLSVETDAMIQSLRTSNLVAPIAIINYISSEAIDSSNIIISNFLKANNIDAFSLTSCNMLASNVSSSNISTSMFTGLQVYSSNAIVAFLTASNALFSSNIETNTALITTLHVPGNTTTSNLSASNVFIQLSDVHHQTANTITSSNISTSNVLARVVTTLQTSSSNTETQFLASDTAWIQQTFADSVLASNIATAALIAQTANTSNFTSSNIESAILTSAIINAQEVNVDSFLASNITTPILVTQQVITNVSVSSNISCSNATLTNVNGSNFSISNVSCSNITFTNLQGSNVTLTNVNGSNFTISNVSSSNITFTVLQGSNATITHVQGVNISFSNANIDNFRSISSTTSNINASNVSVSGFIGVGTSNPQYPIDVIGNINFSGNLLQNGAPFVNSQFTDCNGRVFINGSNVGIGTENWQSFSNSLNVVGGINVDNISSFSTSNITASNIILAGSIYDVNGQPIQFNGASSNHFENTTDDTGVFLETRNFGLGTTYPEAKLHVVGDTKLEGHIVVGNPRLAFKNNNTAEELFAIENTGVVHYNELDAVDLKANNLTSRIGIRFGGSLSNNSAISGKYNTTSNLTLTSLQTKSVKSTFIEASNVGACNLTTSAVTTNQVSTLGVRLGGGSNGASYMTNSIIGMFSSNMVVRTIKATESINTYTTNTTLLSASNMSSSYIASSYLNTATIDSHYGIRIGGSLEGAEAEYALTYTLAFGASNSSIAHASNSKLLLDTVETNTRDAWNINNLLYTVEVKGRYFINVAVFVISNADSTNRVYVRKNGIYEYVITGIRSGYNFYATGSIVLTANPTDTLEILVGKPCTIGYSGDASKTYASFTLI